MFGMLRPCRSRLGERLRNQWTAHLCGMCLALRDSHGHLSRVVTNVDALVVSALLEAQTGPGGGRRAAGPCALRGMRSASVAQGAGAELAAAVSLLLASSKLADHVADGDVSGPVRARVTASAAARFRQAGAVSASTVGLDPATVLDILATQREVESTALTVLEATAPTEAATAAAFRHTAVLAGCPGNAGALAEAGALFGRLAHLLDAVEDIHQDRASGAWNPLLAFDVSPREARRTCDDALLGIRLALADVDFADGALVHALLVHELAGAVERTFTAAGVTPNASAPSGPPPGAPPAPNQPGWGQPTGWEPPPQPPQRRNPLLGCLGWLAVCGTCQACCRSSYTDPCTGEEREGACRNCDCPCDDCIDCGDCCCDCGDCCDCGC